jgi:hypothetical protein
MAHWIENDAQWYEQRMVHCGGCGRLIAKHFLVSDVGSGGMIFCSEDCEFVYRAYVIPERGRDYGPPEDVMERYNALMVR